MSRLKADKRNYRQHDDRNKSLIAKSLADCGAGRSIVVDADNEIIAGNGVYEQAERLGIPVRMVETDGTELVVVKRTDLQTDSARRRQLAVMDNSTSDSSFFDFDLLQDDFGVDELADFGVDISAEEMGAPQEVTEDEVPEHAPPVCQRGDIWQLGRHRLMCGDSTDGGDVALLMDGEKIKLVITDPPYNVAYVGKTKEAMVIENDHMDDGSFLQFLTDAFTSMHQNMDNGAVFYIWHADSEGYNFRSAAKNAGLTVRQCLVWNKNSLVMGRQDYHWKHEPCLYGWKDGAAHFWVAYRKQTTVLEFDRPTRNGEHPTMKPLPLISYQIQNSSKEGWTVADLFGGSGSTLIACEQSNRICYTMELDEKYCDVIIKRYANLAGLAGVKCLTRECDTSVIMGQ